MKTVVKMAFPPYPTFHFLKLRKCCLMASRILNFSGPPQRTHAFGVRLIGTAYFSEKYYLFHPVLHVIFRVSLNECIFRYLSRGRSPRDWYRKMHEFKVTLNVPKFRPIKTRYQNLDRVWLLEHNNSWCINNKKHCDHQRKNTRAMIQTKLG